MESTKYCQISGDIACQRKVTSKIVFFRFYLVKLFKFHKKSEVFYKIKIWFLMIIFQKLSYYPSLIVRHVMLLLDKLYSN